MLLGYVCSSSVGVPPVAWQELPLLLFSFSTFTPLRHKWYPSLFREECLRCFEDSFGKLPRGLRCGGIWLACSLAKVVQEPLDRVPPRHSDLQRLSAELPLLWLSPYGAVVGDSSTEVDSGCYHVVVRVRFSREYGLGVYNHVAYSTLVCLPCEYVVDAFEVTRVVLCNTVVCVQNSAYTRTEEGVHDG